MLLFQLLIESGEQGKKLDYVSQITNSSNLNLTHFYQESKKVHFFEIKCFNNKLAMLRDLRIPKLIA